MNSFQKKHLFSLLQLWESTSTPLDLVVRRYFLKHKFLGARDRRVISEAVYYLVRFNLLLTTFSSSWEGKWEALQRDPKKKASYSSLPVNLQVSFPLFLWKKIQEEYGKEKARELCEILNQKAHPIIRVNALKTTREALFKKWENTYPLWKGNFSPFSLFFEKNLPFTSWPEFKKGLFEIQDESSQRACFCISPKQGESVLDFCAGSGGKSLALAPFMKSPHLLLYDVRKESLQQAKMRLKRAGVSSFALFFSEKQLCPWKEKVDIVLVDAPCSGTGSLRRNPARKYTITESLFLSLIEKQRKIFEKALLYVKPGGKIFYMTCSILQEENEAQVSFFRAKFPLKEIRPSEKYLPQEKGGDGFFLASFEKL